MNVSTDGVEITLDGEPTLLRFTLDASKKINRHFGSFRAANERLADIDQDSITFVIAAALGKPVKDVEDAVFKAGMLDLYESVKVYVNWLANGGRDYVAQTEPKDDLGNG
jgi:hypothetical protein